MHFQALLSLLFLAGEISASSTFYQRGPSYTPELYARSALPKQDPSAPRQNMHAPMGMARRDELFTRSALPKQDPSAPRQNMHAPMGMARRDELDFEDEFASYLIKRFNHENMIPQGLRPKPKPVPKKIADNPMYKFLMKGKADKKAKDEKRRKQQAEAKAQSDAIVAQQMQDEMYKDH